MTNITNVINLFVEPHILLKFPIYKSYGLKNDDNFNSPGIQFYTVF